MFGGGGRESQDSPCLPPTGSATAKNTIVILGIASTIKMYPSLNGKKWLQFTHSFFVHGLEKHIISYLENNNRHSRKGLIEIDLDTNYIYPLICPKAFVLCYMILRVADNGFPVFWVLAE